MSDGGDDEGDVTTLVSAMTGPQSFKRPEAAYAVVKHQPRQLVTTETRTRAYMILHRTYTDECTYICIADTNTDTKTTLGYFNSKNIHTKFTTISFITRPTKSVYGRSATKVTFVQILL